MNGMDDSGGARLLFQLASEGVIDQVVDRGCPGRLADKKMAYRKQARQIKGNMMRGAGWSLDVEVELLGDPG